MGVFRTRNPAALGALHWRTLTTTARSAAPVIRCRSNRYELHATVSGAEILPFRVSSANRVLPEGVLWPGLWWRPQKQCRVLRPLALSRRSSWRFSQATPWSVSWLASQIPFNRIGRRCLYTITLRIEERNGNHLGMSALCSAWDRAFATRSSWHASGTTQGCVTVDTDCWALQLGRRDVFKTLRFWLYGRLYDEISARNVDGTLRGDVAR